MIVLKTARYGRMSVGECVDKDYGFVGCESSALLEADRVCSGRQKCEIPVPYPNFNSTCPRDLKPFLRVSWSCVTGKNNNPWK